MEEDTGKLQHVVLEGKKVSLVDYNRSGVPLVEIVSRPDLSSSTEAKEYLKKVHEIIRAIDVSSADMEKGQMRLEPTVNVCLENESGIHYTPLAEIKNINSFNFASQAIDFEVKRQTEEFENTGVEKSATNKTTRGYDSIKKTTFLQRTKEEAKDYRYFPEPDIPPFIIENELIEKLKGGLPQLPDQVIASLTDLGIDPKYAKIIYGSDEALVIINKYKNDKEIDIGKLASLLANKKIDVSSNIKEEYQKATQKGNTNLNELRDVVEKIVADNPNIVAEYKKGKTNVAGFFVGQAMKETKGQADPQTLNQIISDLLNQQ